MDQSFLFGLMTTVEFDSFLFLFFLAACRGADSVPSAFYFASRSSDRKGRVSMADSPVGAMLHTPYKECSLRR